MKTFLISDTHFGHSNILTFIDNRGNKLRDFNSIEEMDETLIDNWNKVVNKNDKVYHLGDLTFSNKKLNEIMPRLNGTKVLIKGNHDNLKLHQYAQYFKDIRAYHVLDKFVLSHIPIHTDSVSRWRANIHGHLHSEIVTYVTEGDYGELYSVEDTRYINVSVEQINYTPIDFEEIRSRFK